ncbi:MAG: hypothetical protein KA714_13315 [Limnoraphis sp. WC205]|jgi:hypothetical protein|nr:hypothetical protein [Limnoraphis sp. WC205]
MKLEKYNHIISLGMGCLPRTVLTRQGYKRTKAQGELTLPFDLALHSYDGLCEIIKSGFKDYCNPAFLRITQDESDYYIDHVKYHVRFNHESIDNRHRIYAANNYKKLVERYQARITNFYHYIENNNILFVCNYHLYPKQLNQIIKSVFPELTYKIIALNLFHPKHSSKFNCSSIQEDEEEIDYYPMPFPSDNYNWWEAKYFNTGVGIEFENRIGTIISKYVEQINSKNLDNWE